MVFQAFSELCCHKKLTMHAKINAQLEEAGCAEMTLSTLYSHCLITESSQQLDDPPYPLHIFRILGIVLIIPLRNSRIQFFIHIIRSISQWRQPSKQERLFKTLRVKAQISRAAEPTKALPDDTPLLFLFGIVLCKCFTNSFRIFNNAVRAETLHILCLHLLVTTKLERRLRNCSRKPSTALVQ